MLATLRRVLSDDTPGLRVKILGIYAVLLTLNLLCWSLSFFTSLHYPVFLLLAATAYTLGLREIRLMPTTSPPSTT